MSLIGRYFAPLRVFKRLAALEDAHEKLTKRVAIVETDLHGDGEKDPLGVAGIARGLMRCQRCGVVHYGGNGLLHTSANVDGEVKPVVVCGMCRHLIKTTGRGR